MDDRKIECLFLTKNKKLSSLLLELLNNSMPNIKLHINSNYSEILNISNLSLLLIDYRSITPPLTTSKFNPKSTTYPWVILNTEESVTISYNLIQQGFSGEIHYKHTIEHLTKAIVSVLNGELWFSRKILSSALKHDITPKLNSLSILKNISSENNLTTKESETLKLILNGMSNAQISEQCHISINTVKTHISNVYKKIGVHSRQEALEQLNSSIK